MANVYKSHRRIENSGVLMLYAKPQSIIGNNEITDTRALGGNPDITPSHHTPTPLHPDITHPTLHQPHHTPPKSHRRIENSGVLRLYAKTDPS